ncbi:MULTISPECIES: hypothetical protein [unclassified Leptospira]|uniref:hypothetical protein n=1 Tax=unclassified Leptospira TaxID=2633828 RepID=UPI0002BE11F6|nr:MULTISPECIES: hypothetical protein [unclassified Leptospira]EMK01321.1 hypothetical protein LEP1GSC192_2633 [Leptospira sp. B5-022]MCR1794962.1 hypothetical protein [Leptospira sp. id769339]
MKRFVLLLSILQILYCNQAKEVNIDASQSLVGLSLDLTLSNQLQPPDNGVEFAAVGLACSLWTSIDGVTWAVNTGSSVFPDCSGGNLYSIAYGNGLFVAVGTLSGDFTSRTNNCGLWTSPDAVTWSRIPCPNSVTYPAQGNLPLRFITYGSVGGVNKFIAVGSKFVYSSGEKLYTIQSSDGVSWTVLETIAGVDYGSVDASCIPAIYNNTLYCSMEVGSYTAILRYNPAASINALESFPPGGSSVESMVWNPPTASPYEMTTFQFFRSRSNNLYLVGTRAADSVSVSSKMNPSGTWPASVATGFGTNSRPNGFASDESGNIYTFGKSCKWAYSSNQGSSWTSINTLGACGTTSPFEEWMSATYSSKLNRLVVVGDSGSIGTAGISPTLSSDWTYLQVSGITLQITSVTSKSK